MKPEAHRAECRPLQPDLARALKLYFWLTGICILVEAFLGLVLHKGDPYITPFPAVNWFSDFTQFTSRFQAYHTAAFITMPGAPFTYPPVAALCEAPFFLFTHPLACFLTTILFVFAICGVLWFRRLRLEGLSVSGAWALTGAFALSYPLWFEFARANCEFFVWCAVSLGLWSFVHRHGYLAAACFGLAAAMKLYPFILFALLLSRRQYRQLFFGCVVLAVSFVGGLWLESGSVALSWHGTSSGLISINNMISGPIVFYDHSLFELIKHGMMLVRMALYGRNYKMPNAVGMRAEHLYLVTFAIGGILLYVTKIRRLPLLNQIIILTVATVLLPPVSFDYTLIHLFYPCALLMVAAIRSVRTAGVPPGLRKALVMMALLMAPETELSAHGRTLASLVKWVCLIGLVVVAMRSPLEDEASVVDSAEPFLAQMPVAR